MAVDKNKDESHQGLNDYTPKSKDQLQAEKRKRDLNPTLLKNVINSKSAQIINKVMCAKMLANKQIQEQFGLNDQIANQVLFGKKKDNTKASKTLKNQFLPGYGHKDETEKYAKIVAEFSDNMDMIIAVTKMPRELTKLMNLN